MPSKKKKLRKTISVRFLVEFILRNGDLLEAGKSGDTAEAMHAGSKLHKTIQKQMGPSYTPEVSLSYKKEYEDMVIKIDGRADGIQLEDNGDILIDEIKCIRRPKQLWEKPIYVHEAQAMCYAYMYAVDNVVNDIYVQVTYCDRINESVIHRYKRKIEYDELEEWFHKLIDEQYKWYKFTKEHIEKRNESILGKEFPFEYRRGQRNMAVCVYKAIAEEKQLYIQAPTGVGKTMSTIFPTVMAIGNGYVDKIFYMTAKTITRTVAQEAYKILNNNGIAFSSITLTAKEKLCVLENKNCNPDYCERAKGHFDRINEAIFDIINNELIIDRDVLEAYALKHMVCPFEYALDISLFVDGIICDYNYVFDPYIMLQRYFGEGHSDKGKYAFLVDEAHNLVDRAREMYSASISKEDIMLVKKIIGKSETKLFNTLSNCNKLMLSCRRELNDRTSMIIDINNGNSVYTAIAALYMQLDKLIDYFNDYFEENYTKKDADMDIISDFYFNITEFRNVFELLDDSYGILSEINNDNEYTISLLCIDPAKNLSNYLNNAASTVFFSATMLPVNYYKQLLSGNKEEEAIYIESPFDTNNRVLIMSKDVSSKYTLRGDATYKRIGQYIKAITDARIGNYMVFFPSYSFMKDVIDVICREKYIDEASYEIVMQQTSMTEKDREEFLEHFKNNNGVIGACVLGGIFSEGIDLKNESLIGAIIVGTGLPQVCTQRELYKDHFDSLGENGFDYSYRYPGLNKVFQAAGRVIRTSDDLGVIALLDSRFDQNSNRYIFPREWEDVKGVECSEVQKVVEDFWKSKK